MKQLFFFSFFLLLCSNMTEAQTYAAIPDSSHVLVVYKVPENDQDTLGKVSELVKTYYQQTRGIPAGNVVGLDGLTEESFAFAELEKFHFSKKIFNFMCR